MTKEEKAGQERIKRRNKEQLEDCYTVFCDGLCEPVNPGGVATYGYVIYKNDEKNKEGLGVIGKDPGMTNNVAEYMAAIKALEYLKKKRVFDQKIILQSDSTLLINQLGGVWRVHSARIGPFHQKVKRILKEFKFVDFKWIRREGNEEADLLSRKAYYKSVENER